MNNKHSQSNKYAVPLFNPPETFIDAWSIEELDEKFAESKGRLDSLREELSDINSKDKDRKKSHWFIKKLMAKLNGLDIFKHDYVVFKLGQRRRVNEHRRNVINELMRALGVYHDILTGTLEKSCLTTLSDQIGATTFGNKRYGHYAEMELSPEDKRGKKKAVSRVSRAIKMLVELELVSVHYITDDVTGKYVPSIISITDKFYEILLFEAEEVEKARFDKMRQGVRSGRFKGLMDIGQLEQYKADTIARLEAERRIYAKCKRQRKHLCRLSKKEIRDKAQYDIKTNMPKVMWDNMSEEAFKQRVIERQTYLYQLIENPMKPDTFFKDRGYDFFKTTH